MEDGTTIGKNTTLTTWPDHVTPDILWDERDEMVERLCLSRDFYTDSMNHHERLILREQVLKILGMMADRIDEWLPSALLVDRPGNRINVLISILATELQDEADARHVTTKSEAQKMMQEFEHAKESPAEEA